MEDRLLIYDQREIYYTKDDGTFCRCPICGINFRRDAMKIHFLIHAKSGLIHCRECDKQYYFQDERAASVHFEYHISHLSYTCSVCGVSAQFKEHIEDHLRSHHNITYYRCNFCSKNLHSYEEAKHHMYFQHPETRPNQSLIGAASSVPILHNQIVHNHLNKTVLPDRRAIQDSTYSPNETVIGAASPVPILHNQIVHNHLNKTVLPDRRAIQDSTYSPNETVIGAAFPFPILHNQIVHNHLNKTFLPDKRAGQDLTCSRNLTSKYSVNVVQQEKRHIEKIPILEPLSFESNAENSRDKTSCKDQSRSERLMPSSIDEKCYVQSNLSWRVSSRNAQNLATESHIDYLNQVSLANSMLDIPQQSTYVCSNSNISCEVSSQEMSPITNPIQIDDKIHNAEEESTEIFKITDIKSELCWEDVDDFEEMVTWSQQEEKYVLTEDRKEVLHFDGEITLSDQWQMNGNAASGEVSSGLPELPQHYSVNTSKVLECPVCEKMYNINELKEHFYTHGLKRLVCTKCEKTFVRSSEFYYHYLSRHSSVKPFECSLCDRSFKMRCVILRHLRTDHGIRYTCPQCNLKFKYMKSHNVRQCISLKSKPVSSSIKETKKRKCLRKTTKKALRNSSQLISSARRSLRTRPMASNASHLDINKEVATENTEMMEEVSSGDEDDDVTFSERGEMSKGSLIAAEVQPTRKQKDVANLVRAKNNLEKFRSLINDNAAEGDESSVFSESHQLYSINSKKVLQCPLCEEMYNANILRDHYFAHTDKDLVCIMCEKVFSCHSYLYEHYIGYHISVKPFECSLCDKSFKNQGGILQHLKVVHDIRHTYLKGNLKVPRRKGNGIAVPFKGPSVYSDFLQHYSVNIKNVLKCPECQERYRPHVLRRHFYTHVLEDLACTKCKKTFQTKRSLYDHYLNSHSSVKPFECSMCDQSFKLKKRILEHLRFDHGIKYKCPQCNLKFKSWKDHDIRKCNTIKSKLNSLVLPKVKKNKSARKNMKQLRQSASMSSTPSRSRQLRLSRKHSRRTTEMTSNASHLDSQKEVTSEDTELVEAVSSGTEDDDVSFHEKAEMSTGRLMAAEVQLIRKRKDMFDVEEAETDLEESRGQKTSKRAPYMSNMVEGEIGLNESQDQSSDKGGPQIIPSVYSEFLPHYSVNNEKVIKCPVCPERYKAHLLKEHYFTHNVKFPVCKICNKTFTKQSTLYLHYLTRHNSVRAFECSLCFKSFKIKHNISRHLRDNHGIKYKCPNCNLKFKSFKDHDVRKCYILKSKFNDIPITDEDTSVDSDFRRHFTVNTNHDIKCPVCQERYKPHLLKEHFDAHADKDQVCSKCKKVFSNQCYFYQHYISSHTSVKPFECSLCNRSFKLKGQLFMHLGNNHNLKYKCPNCNLKFAFLKDHNVRRCSILKSESKLKDIPVTDKSTSMYSDFRKCYTVNSKTVLECPVCKERYTHDHLKEHFYTHSIKDLECTKCKKTFPKKLFLYQHYLCFHSSVKPFECLLCDKSFKLKFKIVQHLKVDHGIKYKCPQCHMKYLSLRDHKTKKCNIRRLKMKSSVLKKSKMIEYARKNKEQLRHSASASVIPRKMRSSGRHSVKVMQMISNTSHKEETYEDTGPMETVTNKNHNEDVSFHKKEAMSRGIVMATKVQPIQKQKDMLEGKFNCNKSEKQMNGNIVAFNKRNVYSNYLQHYSVSTKKILKCPICEKMCKFHTIKKHIFSHIGKTTICIKCKLPCGTRSRLYAHYISAHNSAKPFECSICNKSFKLKLKVFCHLRTVHGVKYKCPQCYLEFGSLKDHNEKTCMQIIPSENHPVKDMEITTNDSNLDNHMELTTEKTHLSEPIAAASRRITHDDKFQERGKVLTGKLKATEEQSQLISKEMLDMVEGKFNQSKSEKQKNGNIVSSKKRKVYSNYLQHYSVSTKKILKCPICEKICKYHTIKKHIFSHVGKTTICMKCKLPFPTRGNLYDHYMNVHNSVKPFECSLCDKSFKLKGLVLRHLRNAHGVKYKCPQCYLEFRSLNDHNEKTCMQIMQSENHSVKAMEITTNGSNLDNHMELSEPIAAASRRITHDDKFQERGKVLTGRLKATEEQSQPKSQDLHDFEDEEIDMDIPQENKNGTAASSDKYNSIYSNFVQHYCIDNEKVVKCPVCGESHKFFTIRKHLHTHADIGPICVKCDKTFTNQHYLNTHYLKYHCRVKPFKCLKCSKYFKMKTILLHHLRTEHYIKYKCPKCDLEYESLKDHNVTNCNPLKLKIKLVPLAQKKIKKRTYVIKNEPAVKEEMIKQCSRSYSENLKNTAKHRNVNESQTVSRKLYKKKLKKAIKKTRQKNNNSSGSFSKRLNIKKDTKKPEFSNGIESKSIQFTSPGSQEDEPVKMITVDDHSKKQKEMTSAGISANELMPTVSVKTISDNNFPREGEISTGFLGETDVQSQLPLRKRKYNKKNETEQLECLSLSKGIAIKSLQVTPSTSQVTLIDDHSYKQREMLCTGLYMNEFPSTISMKALIEDNSPKVSQIAKGCFGRADTQSQYPFINVKKGTEQPELLSLPSVIVNRNMQITSSGSQVDESIKIMAINNNLDIQREKTWIGFHVNKLMPAVSLNTLNNDDFPKGGQISTGFLGAADAQPQFPFLNSIFTKKSTEQPELASFPGNIGRRNVHITSSEKPVQIISIENPLDKQREMPWTGIHVNELIPAVSKETVSNENFHKGQHKSVGFLGTPDAQSQLPFMNRLYTNKSTEQLELLHFQGDIGSRNLQVPSFGSQVDVPLQGDNHSYKQKEITWTGMREYELMTAASMNTLNDDNSSGRGHRSTGFFETADTQSQLTRKGVHSNMVDLVETQMNQNELQGQKNRSLAPVEDFSEYNSKYYSFDTKFIQKCPICCEIHKPHTIKKHLQSHKGTEPVCILCKMVFRKRSHLHEHYLTCHSSVKPFECLLCDKSFKTKRYVLKHLRTIHGIKYGTPQCYKDLESKMDYYAKLHSNPMSSPAIVFENISNFERQREYNNNESKYHVEEDRSVMVQGTQEDTASHKTGTNDTTSSDKSCHEKAVGISLSNVREVSIPLESGSHCGVPIYSRDREVKEQPWQCGENLASNSKLITSSDSVLEKALIDLDSNTDADMEELQNEWLDSDNRLDMEKLDVQKSTRDAQYLGILGGYNEECVLALQQEDYFVSLWMSETDITDT